MIVSVEIDLTRDERLMELSKTDQAMISLLRIYHASDRGDETCLEIIGKHLWNQCAFPDLLIELCGDDLYGFEQTEALLFTFQTSRESACLFRTACHAPAAVTIVEPTKIIPDIRFDL